MVALTRGQALALQQLDAIAAKSNGILEIISAPLASTSGRSIWAKLSLATKQYRKAGGLPLRDRERFDVQLHPEFPFEKPNIYFAHKRYIGTPHVQWGNYICLYQSTEAEYEPSDGMFGFFDRVHLWMTAAGSGQLDPEDAPLHPPVAYASSPTKLVVRNNTPAYDPNNPIWIGCADLRKVRSDRLDVLRWVNIDDWDDLDPNQRVAAAVLFDGPLAMEYPSKVNDLISLMERAGLQFSTLFRLLRLFAILTPEGEPAYFILGAPMRRKAAGEALRPHLTVWEIAAEPLTALRAIISNTEDEDAPWDDLYNWLISADVQWCRLLEDRPEVVHRRDGQSLSAAINGKRVLLLGGGALGSATAESVVRAGASHLHLVDHGNVKPGLLVRQRYVDADIGLPKVDALKSKLDAFGFGCAVTAEVSDLSVRVLHRFDFGKFDLLIDATASKSVMHRIEEELKATTLSVPYISMSVSAAANHGSVMVRMPGYSGGPSMMVRQAKLEAFNRDPDHTLVKAFWPERSETKIFQPEPGCSEPTFIGSAIDIDFHAAGLLNVGLKRTQSLGNKQASIDLISSPWSFRDARETTQLHYAFEGCTVSWERRHHYLALLTSIARRGINREMKRIARVQSDKIETGGLIFGEIDDSHQFVWIDSVSGPPPDSETSSEKFLCGVSGTVELATHKSMSSGGSSKFIGIWHTHPISRGRPSDEDLHAMVQLLHGQEFPPRQVIMIIVGFSATSPSLNYYLYRREEFRLIPVEEMLAGGEG
jgi:proteasome lid subunit RPN8/RPN11